MAKLNLKAEDAGQERVLEYLEENASDQLVEKINGGTKTMAGCWNYITNRARGLAKNKCAVVEDAEVYGWAVHYFEEEELNNELTGKDKVHEEYRKRLEEQNKKLEEEEKRKKEEKARKEQEKMEELRKRNAEREERVRKKLEEEQRKKAGGIKGQLSLFDMLGGE